MEQAGKKNLLLALSPVAVSPVTCCVYIIQHVERYKPEPALAKHPPAAVCGGESFHNAHIIIDR